MVAFAFMKSAVWTIKVVGPYRPKTSNTGLRLPETPHPPFLSAEVELLQESDPDGTCYPILS